MTPHATGGTMPRAALVTGAARRIGAVVARRLAGEGWAVGVHCHRSRDEAACVVAAIEAAGGRAALLPADLGDRAARAGLVAAAVAALGPLGLLVNNASSFRHDALASLTEESWDEGLRSNLEAPVFLTRDFAAQLPEGAEGAVVNVLDQKVRAPDAHFLSYTVGKVGLYGVTAMLAGSLAPRIRVNAVAPGITLISGAQSQETFEREWRAPPLGRSSTPEEIAEAVSFLATCRSICGETLFLDGGAGLQGVSA
jgi:NAD(P)-dependent dehydrogenase (short-subunit alcohol dehydrogenase family)